MPSPGPPKSPEVPKVSCRVMRHPKYISSSLGRRIESAIPGKDLNNILWPNAMNPPIHQP